MKIIFLDIDGVLNSKKCFDKYHMGKSFPICLDLVQNLNKITRETGAKIVVTSTWRYEGVRKLRERFKKAGIEGKIIGVTPDSRFIRGSEISAWRTCDSKRLFSNYVILDDDDDFFDYQKKYLVRTDSSIGLSDKDAIRAIKILGRK